MRKDCYWLCAYRFAPCALPSSLGRSSQLKIPRIGFLSAPTGPQARDEAFRKVCVNWAMLRARTSVIEWRFAEGKIDQVPRNCRRASPSQSRLDRYHWAQGHPRCQGGNKHDSHCHGTGQRSCRERVRRQPCAAWREYHRTVQPFLRVERKTIGAS